MPLVLLIEDDDSQRFVAAFALKKAGHQVHEAPDGPQGVAKAQELRPDVIVCDVMMPGMTGYEVVATLRKDEQLAHTPIILLTAMSDRKHMRQGMTAGADDYLTKPYRPDELCEAVKAVHERRQNQHEAFLNSMTHVVEGALEEQKEHLGRRYEQQLAKEVNARWTRKADDSGDVHYASAVLLQADLFGPAAGGEAMAERLKRAHQQARDTLYLFGAGHVLAHGSDVVAVFAGDEASLTTAVETRAVRAALALAKSAPKEQPVAIGLHAGPLSLVALHDPLHGDTGHSLVPGPTLSLLSALRDLARQEGWRIAASAATAQSVQQDVATGRSATTAGGDAAVELVPASKG
jgi:DNA-binding response OmpR family regulator